MSQAAQEEAQSAFQWQQSRRKEGGVFNVPVRGFGGGKYTLWLPSPVAATQWTFKNGEPVLEASDSCLTNPAIEAMRDEVLNTATFVGPGRLIGSIAFLRYASTVLRMNYNLTDDDLTFILTGNIWHDGMIRHLLGGDDVTKKLAKLDPRAIGPMAAAAVPPAPPAAPEPHHNPKPDGLLRRLLKLARR